jgi:hypothetical protein
MLGAFVGAAVAVAVAVSFGAQGLGLNAVATRAHMAALDAPPGSCLDWSKQDFSDMHKVACTAPHLFELSASVDLSGTFPKNAPFPDQNQWRDAVAKRCTQPTTDYLNAQFDPFGKFSIGPLLPSQDSWRAGDRTMRCGLQSVTPSGKLLPITGTVVSQDQSEIHPVGTCLGIRNKAPWDPVANCSMQHSYEIVGIVDMGPQFPDVFPTDVQQANFLNTECTKLATAYAGGPDVWKAKNLTLTWDTRKQESWLAGSHKVNCEVGATVSDQSGLAPVTGSVKGDVKIDNSVGPPPSVSGTPSPDG